MERMTRPDNDNPRHTPLTLEVGLRERLDRLAARLRRYVLVEGIGVSLGFALASVAVQVLVDYWARGLLWSMRAAMLGAVVGGIIWCARRFLLAPLAHAVGPVEIANLLERRHPELASILISAVRFSRGEVGRAAANSDDLMQSVVRQAAIVAGPLDFDSLLKPQRARRWCAAIVVMLTGILLTALYAPSDLRIGLARNLWLSRVDWPRQTHLVVELDGDEMLAARGDDVVIQAYAEGRQPRTVEIFCTTTTGTATRENMVTVGRTGAYRYRFTRKNAQEDFTFYLRGGDDRTKAFAVHLVERPRVETSAMRVDPPAYARLDAFETSDGHRAAQVLPGSGITLTIQANKPLAGATLMAGSQAVGTADVSGVDARVSFTATGTHTYHFALRDDVGLENRRPVRFAVRVLRDEPPRVRLSLVGVGEMVTAEAVLPVELAVSDRYGLATVEFVYQLMREGAQEQQIDLPTFEPGAKDYLSSFGWPVSRAAVQAGDRLTLLARASDADDVSGPNTAQSVEHILRVVTRDELLAELARKEQEYRRSFERLVDLQERVRGDLLSVRTDTAGGATEIAVALAPIERRQRSIASSVNVIRQQFQQILEQLGLNGMDTVDETTRLDERIITPLTELASRSLPEAGDSIRRWSRSPDAEAPSRADQLQVGVLKKMRFALANMVQWEGYHEVVTMLNDVIRLQRELGEESKGVVAKEAADIFDK
ncbi:MAG: hypothetical protein ACE5E5_03440 [Phycisphaerae bacterium]